MISQEEEVPMAPEGEREREGMVLPSSQEAEKLMKELMQALGAENKRSGGGA